MSGKNVNNGYKKIISLTSNAISLIEPIVKSPKTLSLPLSFFFIYGCMSAITVVFLDSCDDKEKKHT